MSSLTSRRPSPARLALALALLSFLALPSLAQAAFPGRNGKIAFTRLPDTGQNFEIYTINPDGTAPTNLTNHAAIDFEPAWSADGTKIAFDSTRTGAGDIYTMKADGSAPTRVTNHPEQDSGPAWSPDGTRIAFGETDQTLPNGPTEIFVVNADGSGRVRLTVRPAGAGCPDWSPDGTKIAFAGSTVDNDGNYTSDIYLMNPDGTAQVSITSTGTAGCPSWSPDGTKIAFDDVVNDQLDVFVMNAAGTGRTNLTNNATYDDYQPGWSPDGTKIAFAGAVVDPRENADIFTINANGTGRTNLTNSTLGEVVPDWQPLQYPRPKGATPFRASLVVAFKSCTAPNRQHGPALAFPSCAPPVQESDWLTTGTADSNGQATEFVGSVRFVTLVGNPATPADEADVAVTMSITDVRTKAAMTDYAGELQGNAVLRITDRNNAVPPGGGTDAGTVVDIPFPVNASCAATADPLVGATCTASTSMDAIVPGAVKEGKRAVWQIGQVQVYDGGADGNAATSPNTLFARQGVFVP